MYIFLVILGSLVFLAAFITYIPNVIIAVCLFAIAWAIKTKNKSKKRSRVILIIATIALVMYIIMPKWINHCGVLASGPSCGKSICIGIPSTSNTIFGEACIGIGGPAAPTNVQYCDGKGVCELR